MNYNIKNIILTPMNILYDINPKLELQIMFYIKQGYKLDLRNPKSYSEKINWQKLYYNNELFSICSDKYLVRDYVKSRGCGDTLNELLWQGFNAKDIPFEVLPEKFIIKVTHGSGFNIICYDKYELEINKTVKQLNKWLNVKYLKCYGEKWYGKERPRIIVEKLLEPDNNKLYDYKFFCFDGKPYYLYIDTWRDGKHHINMYNMNFELLPNVSLGYPNDLKSEIKKPDNFEELIFVSKKLSKGFPHVRVDLYDVDNKIVFGEMTFSKGAGFDKILPYEFDLEMGSHFNLIM